MDSKQGCEISLHFCFHITSPSGKQGGKLLDDVRLNNALSAIQTTIKSISEIARENGYKCPSRFTERFHNRFKITPRELRKASRE